MGGLGIAIVSVVSEFGVIQPAYLVSGRFFGSFKCQTRRFSLFQKCEGLEPIFGGNKYALSNSHCQDNKLHPTRAEHVRRVPNRSWKRLLPCFSIYWLEQHINAALLWLSYRLRSRRSWFMFRMTMVYAIQPTLSVAEIKWSN